MGNMDAPALLWFRQDLRLADNPILAAAGHRPVLPVFVLDEAAAGRWAPGGAARWWLHHSLAALGAALAARGAPLLLLRGRAEALLPALAARTGAAEVLAGRLYEPWARARDERLAAALRAEGRRLVLLPGALLREPEQVRSGSGRPYAIYTPFARAVAALGDPPPPLPAPERLRPVPEAPEGEPLAALGLLPTPPQPDWAAEFPALWTPGEAGAQARLARFLAGPLRDYGAARNNPGTEGTSGLSPHLRWGEVSPAQVWHAALAALGGDRAAARPFLAELLWREFSYHLLWHRPEMPEAPLRPRFAAFPWARDPALLRAWRRGRTGYPIVDAGMRQLWRLGWMHNRVRMIAASFLVKHLLQPWQDGAAWFWDTLVDADLASNSASWQWVAGCGTDAAPYFRVFNPVLQGERFDPAGRYVRRFVPELARLPDRYLHRPWEAPEAVLRQAGLALGRDYPRPVVEHAAARRRALATLREVAEDDAA
ncbi:cryptochrome/photolyase family protein [Crenalkalicoccus roseus]|uniref:cryptochrome/photolyase family protein n=1 Tax=Crenalkalicoccus roseus TaxID=1485588 RepID=UPI0038D0D115